MPHPPIPWNNLLKTQRVKPQETEEKEQRRSGAKLKEFYFG